MEIESLKGKKLFKSVMKDVKPIQRGLLAGAILALLGVVTNIASPFLTGMTVDVFNGFADTGDFDGGRFTALIVVLVCVYAANCVFVASKNVVLNNVVSRYFTCKLRVKMSDKIKRLPVSFVDSTSKGELIERMTEDVSVVGITAHSIIDLFVLGLLQLLFIVLCCFGLTGAWR